MVDVIITKDREEASKIAAVEFLAVLKQKEGAVLGLATGSTPVGVYNELAKLIKKENIDMSRVKGFALDEYVGIEKGHPESYHEVINRTVTLPLGLNPDNVHVPNGIAETTEKLLRAGEEYDKMISQAGGIDIQILGLGTDGHIGFNEPATSLSSHTHIVTLLPQTRKDNARFFNSIDEVPRYALTQGIATILNADRLLLLAFGENKAHAVKQVVEGPVSSFVPGSAIQMHNRALVIVDEAAASELELKDYYKEAYENRPEWMKY